MIIIKATATCDGLPAYAYYEDPEPCPDKAQVETTITLNANGGFEGIGDVPEGWVLRDRGFDGERMLWCPGCRKRHKETRGF